MLGKRLPHTASDKPKFRLNKRKSPYYQDLLLLFVHAIKRIEFGVNTRRHLMVLTKLVENSFRKEDLIAQAFSAYRAIFEPMDDSGMIAEEKQLIEAACQRMMDAYWFEDAENPDKRSLSDTSLYILAGKGLHLLERTSLQDEELLTKLEPIFISQYPPAKLLHLNRWADNDEIENSFANIFAVFRRTTGPSPNIHTTDTLRSHTYTWHLSCSPGLPVSEAEQPYTTGTISETHRRKIYTFAACDLTEWLCKFTNVLGHDEAAEMSAHLVRCGLISLVSDKRTGNERAIIWTVRGVDGLGSEYPFVQATGEFRDTAKAIYRITEEGERLVNWPRSSAGIHDIENIETPVGNLDELSASLRDVLEDQHLCDSFSQFLDQRCLVDHRRLSDDLDHLVEFGKAFQRVIPKRLPTSEPLCNSSRFETKVPDDLVEQMKARWEEFFTALQAFRQGWPMSVLAPVPAPADRSGWTTRESLSRVRQYSDDIPVEIIRQWEESHVIGHEGHIWVEEFLVVLSEACSHIHRAVFTEMSRLIPQFKRTPQFIALKSKLGRERSHLGGDAKKVNEHGTFITVSQRGVEQERRFRERRGDI